MLPVWDTKINYLGSRNRETCLPYSKQVAWIGTNTSTLDPKLAQNPKIQSDMKPAANVLKPAIDDAIWRAADIASGAGWQHRLTLSEVQCLKEMADTIRPELNNDPNRLMALPKSRFNLGVFTPRLQQLYTQVREGFGIALIKGLPVDELELIDIAIIYWAIGLHLGQATPNNPEGDMLGHITDLGKTQKDPNSRGYQTREAMDYHCDQCDIVGLICLRAAKSGGVSKVSSSIAMFNEMIRTHPEHAQVLTQPLCWSKLGEYADGEEPFYQSPVFNFLEGKLCVSFGPTHIEKGHALPNVPPLTPLQREAIRVAEDIADQQHCAMVLEPGDMQFLNNYVALHTRTAYDDHDDPALKRLLWRLWLMNPDLRPRTDYARNFQNGVQAQVKQIRL